MKNEIYEAISTFGWFDGKCRDCGEAVLVNQLSSGTHNNRDHPSRSWCTCPDRSTNKGKILASKTLFFKEIRK